MLFGIPSKEIDSVWKEVEPLLKRVIERGQKDELPIDVYQKLIERDAQLWVWKVDGRITSLCVTVICNYPRRRVCQIPYIVGMDAKSWLHYESVIVAYAQERGCTQLEGFCRLGWTRILKNWRVIWHQMRRDI